MPFLRIDVIKGRSAEEIAQLLDAVHNAVLSAFEVPAGDRYQVIQEHDPDNLRFFDTGLGIARSKSVIYIAVTSRPRTKAEKIRFYKDVCTELEKGCGISPSDVIISITTNQDSDWSFGFGNAQFLTGEL